jgi:hypothetical protein
MALLLRGPAAAPAVPPKHTPAAGRRGQDPGSSKRWLGASDPAEEVPTVSLDVEEYSNLAVRLDPRSCYEHNASTDHPIVGGFEVINSQEQAYPAGKLPADDLRLVVAISPRQHNTSHTAGGANYDPAFGATIVRQRRNILNQLEAQNVYEEVDRRPVLPHNERHQL